ncbi:MAG TPA: hypothetical protein EYG92_10935 [Lutibacter sp.]|nr:hypothetical protein [Lutibacter sp.]
MTEKDNGMKVKVDGFINALSQIANDANFYSNVKTLVEDSAADIWNQAVVTVQANNNANPDNRPLYWARIKMQVALKSHPYFNGGINNTDLDTLIKIFEEKSRNYTGVDFSNAPTGAKKILITGFDPFQLNPMTYGIDAIKTQNPSGIVALYLHGKTIVDNLGNEGYIQCSIFPVRYTDFDSDVVEDLVTPFLTNNSVDMIMSLSLNGGAYYFDLERFAAKNRGGFHDNLNVGAFKLNFIPNIGLGSEFYETTLPVDKVITSAVTNNFSLNLQKFFYDQSYEATNDRKHIVKNNTEPNTNINSFNKSEIIGKSIKGSGSNYLSNEIFYRIARVRVSKSSSVKTGHFHLANDNPNINPNQSTPFTGVPFSIVEILIETKNAIKRCLETL